MRASGSSNFWGKAERVEHHRGTTEIRRNNFGATGTFRLSANLMVEVLCGFVVTLESMIPIRDTAAGVTFAVKVQPRAKKNAFIGEVGGALKLALTAPPVEGRANAACIEFLANLLDVPRSSVTIASGETSRNKVIRVAGMTAEEVRRRIGM